jgi:hypothetical protein
MNPITRSDETWRRGRCRMSLCHMDPIPVVSANDLAVALPHTHMTHHLDRA